MNCQTHPPVAAVGGYVAAGAKPRHPFAKAPTKPAKKRNKVDVSDDEDQPAKKVKANKAAVELMTSPRRKQVARESELKAPLVERKTSSRAALTANVAAVMEDEGDDSTASDGGRKQRHWQQ